jgi:tRNA dimethylallyltransferase
VNEITSQPPLLVLVGPTAVGKTAVAIELALRLQGEVVSADSMQVYRGLDIATAKPTPVEMKGVPHHLLDVVDPNEEFNVARYRDLAREAIARIHERGNLPVLSGGTGLYIKAVLGEFLFPDTSRSPQLRRELTDFARTEGAEALHARLAEVDPESAARLHVNDIRRVIRALEIFTQTGIPMSKHLAQATVEEVEPRYRTVQVGLTRPRQQLYDRINHRVRVMVEQGLLQETEDLLASGVLKEGSVAAQALGYKEMRRFLEGECSLEEAVARLQQATRRYAKRQYTWFRHQAKIQWFDLSQWPDPTTAAQAITSHVRHQLEWYKEGPPCL